MSPLSFSMRGVAAALVSSGCLLLTAPTALAAGQPQPDPVSTVAPTTQSDVIKTEHVLVVGDSLSSEYGIERGSGWVSLLADHLTEGNEDFTVTNASISGDTTSGGLTRLPALLKKHSPTIVIIELGGNDALRGLPLRQTEDNLRAMVTQAQESGAQAVLVGMQIPPNYGPTYAKGFEALFAQVAAQTDASLVPFLLDGVETDRSFFIDDGIHPSEQAQPRLLENVWRVLAPLVDHSVQP